MLEKQLFNENLVNFCISEILSFRQQSIDQDWIELQHALQEKKDVLESFSSLMGILRSCDSLQEDIRHIEVLLLFKIYCQIIFCNLYLTC